MDGCSTLKVLLVVAMMCDQIRLTRSVFVETEDTSVRSPGAPAVYAGNYLKDAGGSHILQWRVKGAPVVRIDVKDDGTFDKYDLTTDSRRSTQVVWDGSNFTISLSFSSVNTGDRGMIVDIYRSTPAATVLNTFTTLDVAYCDDRTLMDGALASKSCDYGCTANLSCATGYYTESVEGTCRANATWSENIECIMKIARTAQTRFSTTSASNITQSEDTTNTEHSTVTVLSAGTGSNDAGANTTSGDEDQSPGGGLSESQKAAISIGCLYLVEGIVALVITLALKYGLVTPCIPVYIVSSVLAIPGTFMAAFGNEPKDFDGVEIAGIVFGAVGLAGMLGGVIWQCIQGVKETDYSKGSK